LSHIYKIYTTWVNSDETAGWNIIEGIIIIAHVPLFLVISAVRVKMFVIISSLFLSFTFNQTGSLFKSLKDANKTHHL